MQHQIEIRRLDFQVQDGIWASVLGVATRPCWCRILAVGFGGMLAIAESPN